jgi:hypothetical protein
METTRVIVTDSRGDNSITCSKNARFGYPISDWGVLSNDWKTIAL